MCRNEGGAKEEHFHFNTHILLFINFADREALRNGMCRGQEGGVGGGRRVCQPSFMMSPNFAALTCQVSHFLLLALCTLLSSSAMRFPFQFRIW